MLAAKSNDFITGNSWTRLDVPGSPVSSSTGISVSSPSCPAEPFVSAYLVFLAIMELLGIQLGTEGPVSRGYFPLTPACWDLCMNGLLRGQIQSGSNYRKILISELCCSTMP